MFPYKVVQYYVHLNSKVSTSVEQIYTRILGYEKNTKKLFLSEISEPLDNNLGSMDVPWMIIYQMSVLYVDFKSNMRDQGKIITYGKMKLKIA